MEGYRLKSAKGREMWDRSQEIQMQSLRLFSPSGVMDSVDSLSCDVCVMYRVANEGSSPEPGSPVFLLGPGHVDMVDCGCS